MDQTCFVAMPIRQIGTDDHSHFLAIYEQGIKPVVESMGYRVTRADEVQKTGAITKDIVQWLATADLAIVDLTALNPNVFYEVGVRHALRATGTIMILDQLRTQSIPFDLGSYRVIHFKGDLTGLGELRRSLEAFVRETSGADLGHRDNPVHDALPALPLDAIASAKGSAEGRLREELAAATAKIRRYEKAYGVEDSVQSLIGKTPLGVITEALTLAEEGHLPNQLLGAARESANALDSKKFLQTARTIIEREARLSDGDFVTLCGYALRMGLDHVALAIYEHALSIYPMSREIRSNQLSRLLGSEDPAARVSARNEILKYLGIELDSERIPILPGSFGEKHLFLFSRYLDSLRDDELFDQELVASKRLLERFPERSTVLRNHGRALKDVGQRDSAYEFYQRAMWCAEDVADQGASWLASDLHNQGRYVDSLEVRLFGCMLDPDDSSHFTYAAQTLERALRPSAGRQLPIGFEPTTIASLISCAISCSTLSQESMRNCEQIARRINIPINRDNLSPVGVQQRLDIVSELYKKLASPLTRMPVAVITAESATS